MASWVTKLKETGRQQPAKPAVVTAVAEPLEVHTVTVQVRGSSDNDPGEVALAYFTFEKGVVTLTNEKGSPTSGLPTKCLPSQDPRSVARSLAWESLQGTNRFDRQITYTDYNVV
jgi:hypothetical protein